MHDTNIILNKKQVFLVMIHSIKVLNSYTLINILLQLRRLNIIKQYYLTESHLDASKVIPMLNINSKIVCQKIS